MREFVIVPILDADSKAREFWMEDVKRPLIAPAVGWPPVQRVEELPRGQRTVSIARVMFRGVMI
jgi:hypothetical protein